MRKVSVFLFLTFTFAAGLQAEKLLREIKTDIPVGSRVTRLYELDGHIVCTAVEHPEDFSFSSERFFIDGTMYGPFGNCRLHGFTPDGTRPVFLVREKAGSFLQVGNEEIKKTGYVEYWTWSADGKSLCVVNRTDDGWFVHISGGMFGPYDEIPSHGMPRFLDSGRTPAYISRKDGAYYFHWNDHTSGPYADIQKPEYSPDGKSFAVPVETGKGLMIITNSGAMGPFELIDEIAWSADGSTLACSVMEQGNYFVYAGAARRGPLVLPGEFLFNADNRTITCAENLADRAWLFTGKTRIGPFEYVGSPVASAGRKSVAYAVKQKGKYYLKHGTDSFGPFEELGPYRFSTDGVTLTYSARKDDRWTVYAGNGRLGPFTGPVEDYVFTDKGKKLSFVARKAGGVYAYAEGRENGPFDEAVFLRDDRTGTGTYGHPVVYAARTGEIWYFFTGVEKLGPFGSVSSAWDFSASRSGNVLVYCAETGGETVLMKGREQIGIFENPGLTEVSPDGTMIGLNFSRVDRFYDVLIRNGKEFPGSFIRGPAGNVTGYLAYERDAIRVYGY